MVCNIGGLDLPRVCVWGGGGNLVGGPPVRMKSFIRLTPGTKCQNRFLLRKSSVLNHFEANFIYRTDPTPPVKATFL